MKELRRKTRALLDAASTTHEPSAADRSRVRARLVSRVAVIAAGGAVGAGVASAKSAAAAVATKSVGAGAGAATAAVVGGAGVTAVGVTAKVVVAIAIAGAVSAGVIATRSEPAAPPPATHVVATATTTATTTTTPTATATTTTTATATATATAAPTATVHVSSLPIATAVPRNAPSVATSAPAPNAEHALAEELALVRDAQAALAADDAARALALLDDHARRFPSGVLVEERQTQRVLALCALGQRAEARAAAAHFVAEHPRSIHVARMREACPEPAE